MDDKQMLAFPNNPNTYDEGRGMTLRDYFAAAALPAVLNAYIEANGRCIGAEHLPRNVPVITYEIADAMLKARKS